MQLVCTHCSRTIEFSGDRPSFCAYCGKVLGATDARNAETLDHEAQTLVPEIAPGQPANAPEVIGGYRLVKRLGAGGMGAVYEAEDATSGRRVAIKLIGQDFAVSDGAVQRFRQEGRLASTIAHPRCVFVLAADEDSGRPYIVMELMPGSTLDDLVRDQGPLDPEDAVLKILDVIDGLQEAHRLGVIHRDVKPNNCFLEANGRVKIGDFGLARSLVEDTHLTRTGSFLGTVLFASPEQIRRDPLDQQTDVYSVASTLYYLLTGRAPFQGGDAASTLARIVSDPAPPMRTLRPELPEPLDAVVLRGLERQRERRWRSLAEFREALLPFVPGQMSRGSLGIRFAAFAIDWILLKVVGSALGWTMLLSGMLNTQDPTVGFRPLLQVISTIPWFLCFALPEGLSGTSLGKWLLRLRVRTTKGERPSLPRAILRTFVFYLLWHMCFIAASLYVSASVPAGTTSEEFSKRLDLIGIVGLSPIFDLLLGGGLLLAPMRARNGYRGLHEYLSGTHVVRMPWPQPKHSSWGRDSQPVLQQLPDMPARIGPYQLRGAVRWTANEKLLLADDPVLQRPVWIWIRPAGSVPLSLTRRECSRATRARWLACGVQEGQPWEAFVRQAGAPLPELVRAVGRIPWTDTRFALEQLSEELAASIAEDALPNTLELSQIWIQPNGGLQLLDFAPTVPADMDTAIDPHAAQDRALDLISLAAVCMLEGSHVLADEVPIQVRAPLPGHARKLMERLLEPESEFVSVEQFQEELVASREEQPEVNRPRRLAQVTTTAAFLAVGLMWMFSMGVAADVFHCFLVSVFRLENQRLLEHANVEVLADALGTALHPATPLPGVQALFQLTHDQEDIDEEKQALHRQEEERQARLRALGPVMRQNMLASERNQQSSQLKVRRGDTKPAGYAFRLEARRRGGLNSAGFDEPGRGSVYWMLFLIPIVLWPLLWICWAFLVKGGISYWLTGITIVRRSGRQALRIQCAWRALLVWIVPAALLSGSLWIDYEFWNDWLPDAEISFAPLWISWSLWWLALGVLLSYVALALWNPSRGIHDKLSGTYLVPR